LEGLGVNVLSVVIGFLGAQEVKMKGGREGGRVGGKERKMYHHSHIFACLLFLILIDGGFDGHV